jgi:hypothetical protein
MEHADEHWARSVAHSATLRLLASPRPHIPKPVQVFIARADRRAGPVPASAIGTEDGRVVGVHRGPRSRGMRDENLNTDDTRKGCIAIPAFRPETRRETELPEPCPVTTWCRAKLQQKPPKPKPASSWSPMRGGY